MDKKIYKNSKACSVKSQPYPRVHMNAFNLSSLHL